MRLTSPKLVSRVEGGAARALLAPTKLWPPAMTSLLAVRQGEAFTLAPLVGKHRVSNPAHFIFGRGVGAVCRPDRH
jgi:hypothetical protein